MRKKEVVEDIGVSLNMKYFENLKKKINLKTGGRSHAQIVRGPTTQTVISGETAVFNCSMDCNFGNDFNFIPTISPP